MINGQHVGKCVITSSNVNCGLNKTCYVSFININAPIDHLPHFSTSILKKNPLKTQYYNFDTKIGKHHIYLGNVVGIIDAHK